MLLERIDPKIFRWAQEIVEGGNLLLHRPGESAQHKGPDGLSRNPEGRDQLILAKSSDWEGDRKRIKGIIEEIKSGAVDDEDPEALTIDKVDKEAPEKLEP